MNATIKACAIAAVFAVPAISFAQSSNGPLTRAQVRDQLVQIEQAGYNPATADRAQYPRDIQAAESRVQARKGKTDAGTGVGGATSSAASGHSMRLLGGDHNWRSMYGHR